MKRADRIFAVIGLGLSLWAYLESRKFTFLEEFTPGPGFMPFWVSVVLGSLSLWLLISTYTRRPGKKDDAKLLPERHALVRVAGILALLFGVRFSMPLLGFPLTLVVFTAAILWILEHYSLVKSLAYGVAYAAVTWFIFEYILTMGFPKGFLGI